MSYIVWVHVENDDEADSAPQKAWWSINQFATLKQAIEEAEDICSQHFARTGVEPQRLDDDSDE